MVAALIVGEGDAEGEGLAAGLGLLAAGDADDVGVTGAFESAAGSQAAKNAIPRTDVNRSVLRPISFFLELLISFCLVGPELKSETIIAPASICHNGHSHT